MSNGWATKSSYSNSNLRALRVALFIFLKDTDQSLFLIDGITTIV